MKTLLTIIGLAAVTLSGANATVLLDEPFNVNGTMGSAPYASWTSISGTGTQLVVNAATGLAFGPSDRDYQRNFTSQSGNTFLGFDLRISVLPTSGAEYIAAFADGSGFDGRIFVSSITSGTNFTLGLSVASNTIGASTTSLNLNTTYRVVSRYNPTTDAISLWVGTYIEGSPTISTTGSDASTTTSSAVIRQAGALDNGASAMTFQNFVVSTTFAEAIPEPTTVALIGLGTAFALLRIRRRSRA